MSKFKLDLVEVGSRIRGLRGRMNQQDLAHFLGISQGQLSKIELGKLPPTLEVLVLLSDKFGKTIDWIVNG